MSDSNFFNFSTGLQAIRAPAYIFWTVNGLLGTFCGLTTFIVTVRWPALRQKSTVIIANLAMATVFLAIAQVYNGAKRLSDFLAGRLEITTPLQCLALMIPFFWAIVVALLLVCALSLDRLFSVVAAVRYANFGVEYVVTVNACCWVTGTVHSYWGLLGLKTEPIPVCALAIAFEPGFFSYNERALLCVSVLITFINILTVAVLAVKIVKAKRSAESNIPELLKRLQARRLRSITLLSLTCVAVWMVATFGLALLTNLKTHPETVIKIAPIFAGLFGLSPHLNLIVYLMTSPNFRRGFIQLILRCRKPSAVTVLLDQDQIDHHHAQSLVPREACYELHREAPETLSPVGGRPPSLSAVRQPHQSSHELLFFPVGNFSESPGQSLPGMIPSFYSQSVPSLPPVSSRILSAFSSRT